MAAAGRLPARLRATKSGQHRDFARAMRTTSASKAPAERRTSAVHLSTELPVLAPCEWTGRGVASIVVDDVRQRQGAVAIALVAIVLAVLAIAALLR